jgi:diacylglycerol kinase family enzyme
VPVSGRRGLPSGLAVPPVGNAVLLINPRSGGGTAQRVGLVGQCRALGIEPVVLRPGEDLVALAEAAVAGGAEVLAMAGGDGFLALIAGVAARHRVPMVVVPAGTQPPGDGSWP